MSASGRKPDIIVPPDPQSSPSDLQRTGGPRRRNTEQQPYRYTNEEDGKTLRRYWTTACQACSLKSKCTTGKERRISHWEHEAVLEAVQARLDRSPDKMRIRRQTVEHPSGTIKAWMGSTHFQMKRLENVRTEMALHVLAYNMTAADLAAPDMRIAITWLHGFDQTLGELSHLALRNHLRNKD